ncbi:MAG TPA: ABC transporter substrate-binding protein, partial [Aurantimonas sp.]|nr:ABC transporter substrate-binding protein [Aurantimonas sp.]
QAEALVSEVRSAIDELKQHASVVERGLIVLTTGNKMSAYGPGSRFGMLHTDFGAKAVREDLDTATHGEAISFEFIAETNPDWLFVVDRDAAIGRGAAATMLDNELVRRTDAWKEGHVVYLEPANWYLTGGGIQAIRQNVAQLSEAFTEAE